MYSKTQSAMLFGLDANLISVEVQISKGIPNFIIIIPPQITIIII